MTMAFTRLKLVALATLFAVARRQWRTRRQYCDAAMARTRRPSTSKT